MTGTAILPGTASGAVLACGEGLSFWGGVDPLTGVVIDARHPLHGRSVAGRVMVMPTTRGSCSGSGVVLDLALNGLAPAALVFREAEDVATLGAMIAARMFGRPVPVVRLGAEAFAQVAGARHADLAPESLIADGAAWPLASLATGGVALTARDRALMDGGEGAALATAMGVIVAMAALQGAAALTDVTRGHIDGCILAHDANLAFAERMAAMGARVAIPTTINAISVDREGWRDQGVAPEFGLRASRLADAYVAMGVRPTFTCAPYLLDDPPARGEAIGWSESNAVIYANSVLGARTVKHPDYLDLFVAMTGRAPLAGVYRDEDRAPRVALSVEPPAGADDALWPMLGYLAGRMAPDRIPILTGLEGVRATPCDLKALCAAFGTTSAAPMLHVAGHTPEAGDHPMPAARASVTRADIARVWADLNRGPEHVDLVAFGSPHASLAECRAIAALATGRRAEGTDVIVTLGRETLAQARAEGTLAALEAFGARAVPDLCWCSITEPVLPPTARTLMTNSGKYAHYAPGLSGRAVRFGSLADCMAAARTGRAPGPPAWLREAVDA